MKRRPFRSNIFSSIGLLGTLLLIGLMGSLVGLSSCGSSKTGCVSVESLRPPIDDEGNVKKPKGRSKSGLFPKDMERRMKKGKRKK